MRFVVTVTHDGYHHVQNYIGFYSGQHHIHTPKSFIRWKTSNNIRDDDIEFHDGECGCGLKNGDVREYDGHVWHSEEFE